MLSWQTDEFNLLLFQIRHTKGRRSNDSKKEEEVYTPKELDEVLDDCPLFDLLP